MTNTGVGMSSGFASIVISASAGAMSRRRLASSLRVLFRGDVHGQVAPAAVDAQAFAL